MEEQGATSEGFRDSVRRAALQQAKQASATVLGMLNTDGALTTAITRSATQVLEARATRFYQEGEGYLARFKASPLFSSVWDSMRTSFLHFVSYLGLETREVS